MYTLLSHALTGLLCDDTTRRVSVALMEMSMEISAWSLTRAQQNKQSARSEGEEWETVPQRSRPAFVLFFFCFFKVLFLPRAPSCTFKSENYPTEPLGSLKVQFSHMFLSECL